MNTTTYGPARQRGRGTLPGGGPALSAVCRQCRHELRVSRTRFDELDASAVQLSDALRDREPQTRSRRRARWILVGGRSGVVDPEESFEDPRLRLERNATARIDHANFV